MKRLLALLALALSVGASPASASSVIICNGNTYTWPDQFLNYNYVQNWPLLVNDCTADMAGKVTSATTQATNAAASATAAQNAATTATTSTATQGTSSTSLTIGTGSQSLTIQTGKGILPGMAVRIAKSDGSSNWMDGLVTSYNSGTGALVVNVTTATGSGTYSSWNVFLEGPTGAAGTNGTNGTNGSPVLISTQVASNSAALQWTGLGSTYTDYKLNCNNLVTASTGGIGIQFGEGGIPTWETAAYYTSGVTQNAGTVTAAYETNSTYIWLTGGNFNITNAAGYGMNIAATIFNIPSSGSGYTHLVSTGIFNSTSGGYSASIGGSYIGDTSAKTAIRVIAVIGNITSGQCSLYGMNN